MALVSEDYPLQGQALVERWKLEAQQPFSGWDFSYFGGRYFEPPPAGSYEEKGRVLLSNADLVLDIGTRGGEKLLKFRCGCICPFLPMDHPACVGAPASIMDGEESLLGSREEVKNYLASIVED